MKNKKEDISARAEEMKMIIISELEDSINYQEELFKDDINKNFKYKSFAKGKGVLLSVNFAKLVVNLLKAAQSQSVEGRMYTERDMIAFGVFLGSYQNLEIEEVLDIFNKESGISEKPNNHIESLEKKLMQ